MCNKQMPTPDPQNLRQLARSFSLALVVLLLALTSTPLRAQPTPKRVLVIYWDNKDFPGNVLFDGSFKGQLDLVAKDAEYYPEYMEPTRFPVFEDCSICKAPIEWSEAEYTAPVWAWTSLCQCRTARTFAVDPAEVDTRPKGLWDVP